MDIDFIKWMVDYAEGFEEKFVNGLNMKQLVYTYKSKTMTFDSYYFNENNNYYPLLLQRAIEGVNDSDGVFFVNQNNSGIVVQDWWECDIQYKPSGAEIDQAKEQALKYIYEQEST